MLNEGTLHKRDPLDDDETTASFATAFRLLGLSLT
jgi:hypothetical protein